MTVPHVSRLVPPGPTVRTPDVDTAGAADARAAGAADARAAGATVTHRVDGDPVALGRMLAAIEPLRVDGSATIVTDADAEAVRFLAVLAVLDGRAAMPEYDLDDPSLKWHAAKGVKAVPNAPTIVSPSGGAA